MSRAFDYRIRAYPPTKLAALRLEGRTCSGGRGRNGSCDLDALYELSYRYTTGPAGREAARRFGACLMHAEAFAAKHGVKLPEAGGGR